MSKKTSQSNQVDFLYSMRHSCAHLLAAAVQKLYPNAKFGVGPVIENGFYYDIDFEDSPISADDFPKIEGEMEMLKRQNLGFERQELSIAEAISFFEKANQSYKVELLNDIKKHGTTVFKEIENAKEEIEQEIIGNVSLYKTGDFIDLCRGPHVKDTSEIGHYKLMSVAGAYWRGSEQNRMLTRIYGVAFESKAELEQYVEMMEEAKKRDHKKLGRELELYFFHETAPGSPYWLEKGLIMMNELLSFWREEHKKREYHEISAPLVNKKELWDISGHWAHYKNDMFIADMGESELYGVKPMNCPNAMVIFGSKTRSYRDLPLRLSDCDVLHRYERSGTLNGLLRARSFRQDDSHNFISENQIKDEYGRILEITKLFYGIFNLEYSFRLGTRPEGFLGDIETWNKAEQALKEILNEKVGEGNYSILEGDGAFYGPKVDILMKDALGREWQMGTIQLDFQLPRRFNLTYADQDGTEKIPVVVHRVIYGSLERFIGILVEHFAGAFPVWLSPVQVVLATVADGFNEYAKGLASELVSNGIRVEVDDANETVGNKIRKAAAQKVPYILVIGEKEASGAAFMIRERGVEKQYSLGKEEFIEKVKRQISERSNS